MTEEMVILVDDNDKETGTCEKHEAHLKNLRHRAFSVFLFNSKGETLVQRRAITKYHSGGLWANACCGHPRPGEDILEAGKRRTKEELGVEASVDSFFATKYQAPLDGGMHENEFVHILGGVYEGPVPFNVEEVSEYAWVNLEEVNKENESYAYWFRFYFENHYEKLLKMRDALLESVKKTA